MTTRPDRISSSEAITDLGRVLLSVMLVILLLLPALVIWFADRMTLWWVRRRGGLD
jgi:hypothetical protein